MENRRRGPAAAGNLEGDRIRYYHIYFQTLYQKKGEKKHFVQSKATQQQSSTAQHHQFILKVNEFSLQKKLLCLFYT